MSTGKVNVLKLAQLFDGGCGITIRPMVRQMMTMVFIRSQRISVSPEFYTKMTPSVSSPWLIRLGIIHVGTTSFVRESVLCCQKSGIPLAQNKVFAIAVDPQTRRPVKVPEAVAKFVDPGKKSKPSRFIFPEQLADQEPIFTISTAAMPSDTDLNDHINNSACFTYCLDCASEAAMHKSHVFRGFTKDMAYYNLKSFSVEYRAEIKQGDKVNVQCWEDPRNECVLYFVVKVGEKTACRCVGEWYADDTGHPVEMNNTLRFLEGSVSKM